MFSDVLRARLPSMNPDQRAAFVAGCAHRVFALYNDRAQPIRDHYWNALNHCWGRASGTLIPEPSYTALAAALDAESGTYVDERHESINIPFGALSSVLNALHSCYLDDVSKAEFAADFASNEVSKADPRKQLGLTEELTWQEAWLDHCATAPASAAREEYKRRTAPKPAWYLRWES